MPIYSVRAPDGYTYDIEGPEGASEQDLFRAARRFMQQRQMAQPPETTVLGHVKEAIKGPFSGLIGLGEITAAGVSALLPEETEKAARKKIEEIAGVAKAPFAAAPGYEESIPRRLFEGIGSTLPFFALGPLGLAGRVAAGGIGVAAGAGEAREAAEAKGATPEERRLATQLGAPTGLLDLLAPNIGPLKGMITTALARGGVEGATEAAQKVAQNLIAKGVYDPSQPVLAGSGEEGAYGAGVGALTSLLLDLAIPGRRAAYRPKAEPTPTAEPTPPPQPTPTPTLTPEQQGRQAELETTFAEGQAYPPGPLFPEEPTLYGPKPEPEPEFQLTPPERDLQAERQLELPLEPAAEAAPRDARQPDLIDIAETQQAEELIRTEKMAPVVGARNEAEIARVRARRAEEEAAQVAAKEQARLKFESDLAELGGRLEATQQKTTQDTRLQLLLPIVEDPAVTNIPRAFTRALREQGFTDLKFTDRERSLIRRAVDFKQAAPVTPEAVPSAPSELTELEAAIPEKEDTRVPEQPSFPGMGRRGAAVEPSAVEPEVTEAPAPTVLTPEVLDQTGLPKQSGFYKQLVNKDMTDPGQAAQIQDVFSRVQANPRITESTKQAVSALEGQRFRAMATQQEMFGPRGGVLPTAVPKKGVEVGAPRTVPSGVGVSPAVPAPTRERAKPGKPRAPAALTTEAPKRDRLAARKEPARVVEPREERKSAALTRQEAASRLRKAGYDPKEAATLIKDNTDPVTNEVDPKAINEATSSFFKLTKNEVNLTQPLSADVLDSLKTNDVSGALDTLSKQTQGELGQIARALSRELRRAKIEVMMVDFKNPPPLVERLFEREPDGKKASGFYATSSAGKRYLVLDTNTGLDAWTLMHEATHAATDSVLENKSHPMTVQLTKLFEDVKPLLGTAYGAEDVKEFASETFSNTSFRQKLAAINLPGKPTTALQRFANIIINFVRNKLGKSPKSPESALDAADSLINKIIATNHGDAGVGSLYRASFLNKGDQVLNAVAEARAKYPKFGKWWVDTAKDGFAGARRPAKKLVMSALEAPQLADLAKSDLPMAPEFGKIVNAQNDETATYIDRIATAEKSISDRAKKLTPKQLEILKYLVIKSTSLQVDPSKPFLTYKGKVDADGVDKEAVWKEMQDDWESVRDTGRSIYNDTRDAYIDLRRLQEEANDAKIDAAVPDKEEAKKVKSDFRALLSKHGYLEPYFALNRVSGPYRVYYTAISPYTGKPDVGIKHFNSPQERERGIEELLADTELGATDIRRFEELTTKDFSNAPPTSFVNAMLRSLKANKVSKEATDEVMQLVLNSMPDKSFFQTSRARKGRGRLGADEDFLAAFGSRSRGMVRQFVANKYAPQLNSFEESVRDYVSKLKDYNYNSKTAGDTSIAPGDRVLVDMQHKAGGTGGDVYTYIGNQAKTVALPKVDFSDTANWRPVDIAAAVDYAQEYISRVDTAKNPSMNPWSRAIKSANFSVTLAGNISSALIEAVHVPMFIFPALSADYGLGNANRAIGKAFKTLFAAGRTRKVSPLGGKGEGIAAPKFYSILNYDFTRGKDGKLANKDNAAVEHLETLVRIGAPAGQFSRDISYEVQGIEGKGTALDKVNQVLGSGLHYMGRISREITLISAYELELKKVLGKKPFTQATEGQKVAAAQKAIDLANLNYGSTTFGTASRLAQGDITSILFMYRQYNVRMYYLLFGSYLRDALKNTDPKLRAQAAQKFVSTLGMTALFSGASGLPMFGALAFVYNMFTDEDEDDLETVTRKGLGSTLYSGIGDALLGVQLSSRVGLSDLLFKDSISSADKTRLELILEAVGGSVYGSAARIDRGLKLISDGYADRGIEQVLPVPVANILKAVRYGTEGTTTLRGDPITGDVSDWNVFAQALGFAPADYIRQMEENAATNKISRGLSTIRTKLYQRYYMALRTGDSEGMQDTLEDIMKFNERHPLYSIKAEDIVQSVKERMRRSAETQQGVYIPKSRRAEMMRLAAEFDGEDEED